MFKLAATERRQCLKGDFTAQQAECLNPTLIYTAKCHKNMALRHTFHFAPKPNSHAYKVAAIQYHPSFIITDKNVDTRRCHRNARVFTFYTASL